MGRPTGVQPQNMLGGPGGVGGDVVGIGVDDGTLPDRDVVELS